MFWPPRRVWRCRLRFEGLLAGGRELDDDGGGVRKSSVHISSWIRKRLISQMDGSPATNVSISPN